MEKQWLRELVEEAYREGYIDGCCQPQLWPKYDDDAWLDSCAKAELEDIPPDLRKDCDRYDEKLCAPTDAVINQEETIIAMRTEGALRVAAYHARLRAMG